jgi:hypothetical protein
VGFSMKWPGLFDIIFESDDLQIVNEINSEDPNMSSFGHFAEGIKHDLNFFQSSHVAHVKRDANATTHGLAREVVTHVIDKINWLEDVPPCIYGIVNREIIVPIYVFISAILGFFLVRIGIVQQKKKAICITGGSVLHPS